MQMADINGLSAMHASAREHQDHEKLQVYRCQAAETQSSSALHILRMAWTHLKTTLTGIFPDISCVTLLKLSLPAHFTTCLRCACHVSTHERHLGGSALRRSDLIKMLTPSFHCRKTYGLGPAFAPSR